MATKQLLPLSFNDTVLSVSAADKKLTILPFSFWVFYRSQINVQKGRQ